MLVDVVVVVYFEGTDSIVPLGTQYNRPYPHSVLNNKSFPNPAGHASLKLLKSCTQAEKPKTKQSREGVDNCK